MPKRPPDPGVSPSDRGAAGRGSSLRSRSRPPSRVPDRPRFDTFPSPAVAQWWHGLRTPPPGIRTRGKGLAGTARPLEESGAGTGRHRGLEPGRRSCPRIPHPRRTSSSGPARSRNRRRAVGRDVRGVDASARGAPRGGSARVDGPEVPGGSRGRASGGPCSDRRSRSRGRTGDEPETGPPAHRDARSFSGGATSRGRPPLPGPSQELTASSCRETAGPDDQNQ